MKSTEMVGWNWEESLCERLEAVFKNEVMDCAADYIVSQDSELGGLEKELRKGMSEVVRMVLERAMQAKADQAGRNCPKCGQPLRNGRYTPRTIKTSFGPVTLKRWRGKCSKCDEWVCPADILLRVEDGVSPYVQEMATAAATKLPIAPASELIDQIGGLNIAPATLDRMIKRLGEKSQESLERHDQQTREGSIECRQSVETLVIQIDAWNARERDFWGENAEMRKNGEEPKRWHWVRTATIYRLDQSLNKAGRPQITQRAYVATREDMDTFRPKVHAEALRQGLGQAKEVLILGDGAVWIWNLAQDRFPQARQRLDYYHLRQHLWNLAQAIEQDPAAARAWLEKQTKNLRANHVDDALKAIDEAIELQDDPEKTQTIRRERNYIATHRDRMDYDNAQKQNEPIGSGAIESTCKQYQCRFKLSGQFWSQPGIEKLLSLATLERNDQLHLIFPHLRKLDLSKN